VEAEVRLHRQSEVVDRTTVMDTEDIIILMATEGKRLLLESSPSALTGVQLCFVVRSKYLILNVKQYQV